LMFCFMAFLVTRIRIQRLSIPASKIYVTNCIGSVDVPTQAKTCEEMLITLIDLFWLLR
ncbi:uncharacterized protein EV154DRAFT_401169, partial [Mucor mucedo]|uniref:uncharacterized protein n=1 Tax=Mucor mucedo TaxID=29922 RepID=UPI00221FC68E